MKKTAVTEDPEGEQAFRSFLREVQKANSIPPETMAAMRKAFFNGWSEAEKASEVQDKN